MKREISFYFSGTIKKNILTSEYNVEIFRNSSLLLLSVLGWENEQGRQRDNGSEGGEMRMRQEERERDGEEKKREGGK